MVAHLHIQRTLGQRDTLALTINGLHSVEHVDSLFEVLLLDIQPVDGLKQFLTTLVLFVHLLEHGNSVGILFLADI